jgi:hypothetical protein
LRIVASRPMVSRLRTRAARAHQRRFVAVTMKTPSVIVATI